MSTKASVSPASNGLTDYEKLAAQPSLFVEHVCGVEPFEYQEGFLDADARHRVIASGRQVGKSRMCAWLALHRVLTEPHAMVLITAPSLRQSSLLFSTLVSEIGQSGLSDDQWGIERDTQTILEFDNGSAIHCVPTGRDGNNIRGYTANVIVVDEAAFVDDTIFEDILEPMTWATQGELILASTPYGKSGYFYQQFKSAEHDDEWANFQVSSYSNPLVKETDLDKFKQGKTETQIKRELLGKFDESGDSFFPTEAIRNCIVPGKVERTHDKAWLGVDVGGSGDDPTVFYGVDADGNVFIYDEVYENMGVLDAPEHAKMLDAVHGFDGIYIDRTAIGEGAFEALSDDPRFTRKVNEVYFTLQKKQQLFQRMKAALEAGYLSLPNIKDLRDQLEAIEPQKSQNGALRLQPKGNAHDDHVDSLALACWGLPEFGDQSYSSGAKQAVTGNKHPTNEASGAGSGAARYGVVTSHAHGHTRSGRQHIPHEGKTNREIARRLQERRKRLQQ